MRLQRDHKENIVKLPKDHSGITVRPYYTTDSVAAWDQEENADRPLGVQLRQLDPTHRPPYSFYHFDFPPPPNHQYWHCLCGYRSVLNDQSSRATPDVNRSFRFIAQAFHVRVNLSGRWDHLLGPYWTWLDRQAEQTPESSLYLHTIRYCQVHVSQYFKILERNFFCFQNFYQVITSVCLSGTI